MDQRRPLVAAGPAVRFCRGAPAMAAAYGMRPAHTLAEIPSEFDGTKFQLAAPEPNPKRGGVLRFGILNRPPHFDFHQSGTVGNLGARAACTTT